MHNLFYYFLNFLINTCFILYYKLCTKTEFLLHQLRTYFSQQDYASRDLLHPFKKILYFVLLLHKMYSTQNSATTTENLFIHLSGPGNHCGLTRV